MPAQDYCQRYQQLVSNQTVDAKLTLGYWYFIGIIPMEDFPT